MDLAGVAAELWGRIFSWEWLGIALVIALATSLFVRGIVSTLVMTVVAVIADALAPVLIGAVLAGALPPDVADQARAILTSLPPDVTAVKALLYAMTLYVFAWSLRDMTRHYEPAI